jgi:hypothetical protein
MKQAASRSIKSGWLISGCFNKSVHGPLRGGNWTSETGIALARGVRRYKHLKVQVGWCEIIDAHVSAITRKTTYSISNRRHIIKNIQKSNLKSTKRQKYL